jgi:nicotinate-nucleotide adenylyltransferase
MTKRLGIYAGTFDPVHIGHITFALQALEAGNLDHIYFLPERRPRAKVGVEHFGHRVAMLKRALRPYPQFSVLELVDVSFSVQRTLPTLQQKFAQAQLVFLFGSDVIPGLAAWPNADKLLEGGELIIGLRNDDNRTLVKQTVDQWPTQPKRVTIFSSYAPQVSSGKVRSALRKHQPISGLLQSVERYSDHNWLYVSLEHVDIPSNTLLE